MKPAINNDVNQPSIGGKYFTVPGDMLIDILNVLVNNSIIYQVKSVDLNENSILLYITQEGQSIHYAKAIENIDVMLDEYRGYSQLL